MTEAAEESDEEAIWNSSMRRQVSESVARQGMVLDDTWWEG